MKTHGSKVLLRGSVGIGLCLMLAAWSHASYSPVANLTERFDSDPNWKLLSWAGAAVSKVLAAGELSVRFTGAADLAYPNFGSLCADATASGGRFVGSYNLSGIREIVFDVKWEGVQDYVNVLLACESTGRAWLYRVALPEGVSQTRLTVPLAYSAGWFMDGGTEEMFAEDLEAISSIEVQAERDGVAEGFVAIDNFKLVGPWGGPFTADGLPVAWLQEYGIGSGDGHADEDPDGDGFNNYGEYLAGTDPHDPNSLFTVEIARNEQGQAVLRWKHEFGRSFSVLRAQELAAGFTSVCSGITSVEPRNEVVLDEQGSGPYYYRVRIDQ